MNLLLPSPLAAPGLPVGAVCAFAGQVTPASEGSNTIWADTACQAQSSASAAPQVDEPVVLLEAMGWMLCDGRFIGVAQYAALFGALGYLYGRAVDASGASTFRIPDYRGLFLRGVDDGAGMDPDASARIGPDGLGQGGGVGSLQCGALQDHTHDDYLSLTAEAGTGANQVASSTPPTSRSSTSSPSPPALVSAAETRPKNIYVHYIIKFR